MVTAWQCRGARGILEWTLEDLSKKATVAKGTLVSFEKSGRVTYKRTLEAIRLAFETAGIVFLFEEGRAVGLRFDKAPDVDVARSPRIVGTRAPLTDLDGT